MLTDPAGIAGVVSTLHSEISQYNGHRQTRPASRSW